MNEGWAAVDRRGAGLLLEVDERMNGCKGAYSFHVTLFFKKKITVLMYLSAKFII